METYKPKIMAIPVKPNSRGFDWQEVTFLWDGKPGRYYTNYHQVTFQYKGWFWGTTVEYLTYGILHDAHLASLPSLVNMAPGNAIRFMPGQLELHELIVCGQMQGYYMRVTEAK